MQHGIAGDKHNIWYIAYITNYTPDWLSDNVAGAHVVNEHRGLVMQLKLYVYLLAREVLMASIPGDGDVQ